MDTQIEDRFAPPDQPPPFPDNVGMSSIMAYQNPTGLPGGTSTPASLEGGGGSFSERFAAATPGEASTARPDGTLAPVNTGAITSMPTGLQQQQLDIERRRVEANRGLGQRETELLDQDQQRMHRANEAQGIGPSDLPNWQEQEQRQKFMHTPVEAFGSLGSIFAMVASAFTRKPVTNSLNAAAAALNAVKKGDDAEYDRAHKAWEENTNLALKRQQIQHQAYTDAIQLMDHDMKAGEAKFSIAARQYGDEALLSLYEHGGMSKDIIDQINNTNKMALGMGEAATEIDKQKYQEAGFKNDWRTRSGDPTQVWQAWNDYYGKHVGTVQQMAMQQLLQRDQAAGVPLETTIENAKQIGLIPQPRPAAGTGPGGNPNLTFDRRSNAIAGDVYSEELAKLQPKVASGEMTKAQAEVQALKIAGGQKKEIDTTARSVSGATAAKYEVLAGNAKRIAEDVDKIEQIFSKHWGVSGFAGMTARKIEAAGNMLGFTNSTDYQDFERYVKRIQSLARGVITPGGDTKLKGDLDRLDVVVPGLLVGQSGKFSSRAYEEFSHLIPRIRQELRDIAAGKHPADTDAPAPASKSGYTPGFGAPVVGQ